MGKEILENVAEHHKFWLANGKQLSSVKELHNELKKMNEDTFKHHVNDAKNDFYNWVKEVYKDRQLADDLLECNTKEAMMFCLSSHLNKAEVARLFQEIPTGYYTERTIFEELPRGYDKQRVTHKSASFSKPLVTLINLKEIKNNSAKVNNFKAKKKEVKSEKKNKVEVKKKDNNEDLSFNILKKVKPMDQDSIIKKIKEVYGVE